MNWQRITLQEAEARTKALGVAIDATNGTIRALMAELPEGYVRFRLGSGGAEIVPEMLKVTSPVPLCHPIGGQDAEE